MSSSMLRDLRKIDEDVELETDFGGTNNLDTFEDAEKEVFGNETFPTISPNKEDEKIALTQSSISEESTTTSIVLVTNVP